MNIISPVVNTSNIILADFVRVTTVVAGVTTVYRFATSPYAITVPAVDAEPFSGLGALVKIGDAQRDIKSTANETTVTLVGLDTSLLGWVLGQNIKGSKIEMWHGFFDTNGTLISNLLTYSQDFTNAIWNKVASSITPNAIAAPDGTLTGSALIENNTTSSRFVQNYQLLTIGNTYTFSISAKALSTNRYLSIAGAGLGGASECPVFDLTTGILYPPTTSTIFKNATITPEDNGWYRCTCTIVAINTQCPTAAFSQSTSNHTLQTYLGDGVSGFYIWGEQIQQTAQPSKYTPTTSTAQSGLYKFFTGFINAFTISEQWMEDIRQFVGTIGVSASSVQIILQNRTAGRYTNDSAWQFFNAGDTSMNRVGFIQTINYQFGKDAPANS